MVLILVSSLTGCSSPTSKPASIASTTRPSTPRAATTVRPTFLIAVPRPGFVVSPSSVGIGSKVTFSGVDCPSRDRVLFSLGSGDATNGTSAIVAPRKDGSWSKALTVADSTHVGNQSAGAECVEPVHHAGIFRYVPFAVNVTTFRRLYVQPTPPVRPGTVLMVTQSGGCPGEAVVSLNRGSTNIVSTYFVDDAAGNWSGHLSIPPDAPRGSYTLTVECDQSRSRNAFYPAVAITVG